MATYLKRAYPSVEGRAGITYGGSQTLEQNQMMRKYGCGIIASADLLLYLRKRRDLSIPYLPSAGEGPLPLVTYQSFTRYLRQHYFPLIPGVGLNVFLLVLGLKRCLRGQQLQIRWGVRRKNLWNAMGQMLSSDIPVILAIGRGFPNICSKQKVAFYAKTPTGEMRVVNGARSHFVVVTGMDENWLRISSWGKEYYVLRSELMTYMTHNSNSFLTNILYIY